MSATGGPQAPEDGWQTRWLTQAAALLLHSPLTILIGFFGVVFCAILAEFFSLILPGIWGYVLRTSIICAVGGLVPVAICASLAISEGHGTAKQEDIKDSLKSFMVTVFFLNSLIISLAVIMLTMQINMGASVAIPERSEIDTFLNGGIATVSGGLFATLPVNVLWVTLVTQMPMSFSETRMSGFLMIRKNFQSWSAIVIVSMLVLQSTLIMPALLGTACLIFLSAWLYVAGREIFGGISSNRYSLEAKSSLMEA
jgi:hypothetical protein